MGQWLQENITFYKKKKLSDEFDFYVLAVEIDTDLG